MSTAALSIITNSWKDPNSSTVKEKYITVYSYNAILCDNTGESQEKNVNGKKQITLKRMPIVAFHYYKIKKTKQYLLFRHSKSGKKYLYGRKGCNLGEP